MMKPALISSILMLTVSIAHGQNDMQKQLDELKARIKTLEKENDIRKSNDRSCDSAVYCSMRSEIFIAFTGISQLDLDFKNTADKIAITGLFAKLIQASNPTSDILGFRFTDIIMSAAEDHFLKVLENDQDKKRFSQVIRKIIDNPVVTSLANTNPVTSVVAAIINTIAGFSTSRVELEKEGGRIRDVSVDQKDVFDNKSINAFRDDLKVYIDFYDAMIFASSEYIHNIESLNNKYRHLIQYINIFKTDLYTQIKAKGSNFPLALSNLLPDPSLENIDYNSLINNHTIIECASLAGKYPSLEQEVNKLKHEYNQLLYNFLTNYISILRSADEFPDHNIDKSKTENLLHDIETFLLNLEL